MRPDFYKKAIFLVRKNGKKWGNIRMKIRSKMVKKWVNIRMKIGLKV